MIRYSYLVLELIQINRVYLTANGDGGEVFSSIWYFEYFELKGMIEQNPIESTSLQVVMVGSSFHRSFDRLRMVDT